MDDDASIINVCKYFLIVILPILIVHTENIDAQPYILFQVAVQ